MTAWMLKKVWVGNMRGWEFGTLGFDLVLALTSDLSVHFSLWYVCDCVGSFLRFLLSFSFWLHCTILCQCFLSGWCSEWKCSVELSERKVSYSYERTCDPKENLRQVCRPFLATQHFWSSVENGRFRELETTLNTPAGSQIDRKFKT